MVRHNVYKNCPSLCGFREINIMFDYDADAGKFIPSGNTKKWVWQKKKAGCKQCQQQKQHISKHDSNSKSFYTYEEGMT